MSFNSIHTTPKHPSTSRSISLLKIPHKTFITPFQKISHDWPSSKLALTTVVPSEGVGPREGPNNSAHVYLHSCIIHVRVRNNFRGVEHPHKHGTWRRRAPGRRDRGKKDKNKWVLGHGPSDPIERRYGRTGVTG